MSNLKIQHVSINNDRKPISQNESKRPIKSSAKPAVLALCAMTMLGNYGRADVIDIRKEALQKALEVEKYLGQYDKNNDGFLSEEEQLTMPKSETSTNVTKSSTKKSEINKKELDDYFVKLICLSNGLNADGTKPKGFWNSLKQETRNVNQANHMISTMKDEFFIDFAQRYAQKNWEYIQLDVKTTIIKKLLDYRCKNLPKDFVPNTSFIQNSGLFEKIIYKGMIWDTDTGKYQKIYNFSSQLRKFSSLGNTIKENYANNFAIAILDPKVRLDLSWTHPENPEPKYLFEFLLPQPMK